ncbi:GNAT family N-acetyltransferase [Streptomyces sp. SL13]|uniref:GNAT family N-acetyltransferase n=1 Tax=Streptantibioticus silvisoli TaxID=2705255 RepID=A0AA90K0R2_9ACTN|nr:GNAT family N-acetyltransferase [Streptantibioticus silvisoli]MDI5973256.1 GNAT family N-acetyltransferase [Streptantibioticus silvisoli]
MSAAHAVVGPEVVRGLQEGAARALPVEYVEHVEGWWMRHSPGGPWWAGTVLPHGGVGPEELLRRVVRAEEFYAAHGVVARIQIAPGACPPGLDALLAERGYRAESPVSLQAALSARVADLPAAGPQRVRVDDRPTARWLDAWHAVKGGDPLAERDRLTRLGQPCGYARATVGDEAVAVGRVVVDGGWAGVFGMATLPRARGTGAGRRLLAALARWAAAHRADRMYLQVEDGNVPALRLYEKAGFTEICAFHYRTRD